MVRQRSRVNVTEIISEGNELGFISVAMCTFNGSRFLPSQLASIAAQDRPPDELVVCDDGSSDGCDEILKDFCRCAPFSTQVVVNDKTLGSTKNFEKAVSLCRGEIVVLADQDDLWYRHKLKRIEEAFLRSSAIAVFSDADLMDEQSRLLGLRLWETFSFSSGEQRRFANGQAFNILLKRPLVTGATLAFRKKCFDLLSPIPANYVHDRWLSFLFAIIGRYQLVLDPLIKYRLHKGQQMGPGGLTLRDRIAKARTIGPGSYLEEIEQYRQLYERLEERRTSFPHSERSLEEIQRKISHLRHRVRLRNTSAARASMVLQEMFNGGYWRYADGWKSIVKDLVLR